jgi:hypothetical protein
MLSTLDLISAGLFWFAVAAWLSIFAMQAYIIYVKKDLPSFEYSQKVRWVVLACVIMSLILLIFNWIDKLPNGINILN